MTGKADSLELRVLTSRPMRFASLTASYGDFVGPGYSGALCPTQPNPVIQRTFLKYHPLAIAPQQLQFDEHGQPEVAPKNAATMASFAIRHMLAYREAPITISSDNGVIATGPRCQGAIGWPA